MHWTDRQRAMLQVIGVRVWVPPPAPRLAGAAGTSDDDSDPAMVDAWAVHEPVVERVPVVRRIGSAPATTRDMPSAPVRADTTPDPAAETRSRAERIAAMDWSALRDSAAACTACELHKGRTHSVFASAPGQADWFVVGDPPSADDDRDGVPLAADAGRLLDNLLAAAQLSRASTALVPAKACVTTVVKCHPPGDRTADASEIAACAPYLQRQIELVRPKVVLAMGRCAAQGTVASTEPIGKLRGTVHRMTGAPVVVTFHPSHLLRHGPDKAKVWEDLCRAVTVVDGA